jgi:hypothetical protein
MYIIGKKGVPAATILLGLGPVKGNRIAKEERKWGKTETE